MSKREDAVRISLDMAADPTHGYDQSSRWGPDYDCSSFVISVWDAVGTGVKAAGATYTGNMYDVFTATGFVDVTDTIRLSTGDGLLPGDVLLNHSNHTAMYIGEGRIVHASINERGGITGGHTGDQTGGEIGVRDYYNYPWDAVLRFREDGDTETLSDAEQTPDAEVCEVKLPLLRDGSAGKAVLAAQTILTRMYSIPLPVYGCDGEFGAETEVAVEHFQEMRGLEVDGIIGKETWSALLGGGTKNE